VVMVGQGITPMMAETTLLETVAVVLLVTVVAVEMLVPVYQVLEAMGMERQVARLFLYTAIQVTMAKMLL